MQEQKFQAQIKTKFRQLEQKQIESLRNEISLGQNQMIEQSSKPHIMHLYKEMLTKLCDSTKELSILNSTISNNGDHLYRKMKKDRIYDNKQLELSVNEALELAFNN